MIRSRCFRLIVLVLVFSGTSCGVKTPPKPPGQAPPAAVDLRAETTGDALRLIWSIPEWSDRRSAVAGCRIYRNRTEASAPECPACPIRYELAGQVPFSPQTSRNRTLTYAEPLSRGYRYRYKVVVYTDDGRDGEASSPITVVH